MEKAKGGGDTTVPKEHRSNGTTGAATLADMGVSKDQSAKWQQLAAVPEDEFEAALAASEKPSTTGIINSTPRRNAVDDKAIWFWGRLRDFERDELFAVDLNDLLSAMTDAM